MRRCLIIPFFLLAISASCQPKKAGKPDQLIADLKELSSDKYQGRKMGSAGSQMAASYISERFAEIGLKSFNNSYRHKFSNLKAQGTNVLGYIEGKKKNEVIVISAHFDHIGIIDGKIYNGADDNASGVAVLLSLAKYFAAHKPQQTLIFAAFDGEEAGFLGARYFVAHPPLSLNKVILNINMDMVSRADNGKLYAAGAYHYPNLKKYLTSTNKTISLIAGHDDPKLGKNDWTKQSDHYAFLEKGIPFIYFGVEDHSDYHSNTDDFERIDTSRFLNCAAIIQEVVLKIDAGLSLQNTFREKLISQ
ncbi:M28 family peptidase [Desertivirga xinjiangensis]|uniref:M28 family peptidase n=1 Tax=Desertivirga xinjiangensis TaxID=539206 RepID=UPI00210B67D4|nr:M28 family peptidase [Pedobacter xinjiangensis]